MEAFVLLALLAAPVVMLLAATRLRRARERRLDENGVVRPRSSTSKSWDKGMRNAMLIGLTGALLVIAGLYAWAIAVGTRLAPVFGLPIVAGVVMLSMAYRTWMRAVSQVPDDPA